jgi:hypothetical protein
MEDVRVEVPLDDLGTSRVLVDHVSKGINITSPSSLHKSLNSQIMASKSAISHACRITLFTRSTCSLCTTAREVLDKVRQRRPFEFSQLDVMDPKNLKWKIYEFDVPVVGITLVLNL